MALTISVQGQRAAQPPRVISRGKRDPAGTASSHSALECPLYVHPVSSVHSNPTSSCLESVPSNFLHAIAAAHLSPPLSPSSLPHFLFLAFSMHSRFFCLYGRGSFLLSLNVSAHSSEMDSVQQTSSAAFFNTLLHYRAPAYSPIPPLLSLPITLPYSLKATQNPSPAPEQGHIQVQGESA